LLNGLQKEEQAQLGRSGFVQENQLEIFYKYRVQCSLIFRQVHFARFITIQQLFLYVFRQILWSYWKTIGGCWL